MNILAIKQETVSINDFQQYFSNGLNVVTLNRYTTKLPSFATDYILGTADVTSFILQELDINDAKMGRLNVVNSESISVVNLADNVKGNRYSLYYVGQTGYDASKLYRYKFTDNAVNYISEPFFLY